MAFRQIKAPAIANEAVLNTKLAPSALAGQSASLAVNSLINDTLLVHVANSDVLNKITVKHLVDSLDTDLLTEGAANLYFTDARAKTAVSSDIASAVAAEAVIARAAEVANASSITNEASTARSAESANATAITNEASRATGIEAGIVTAYQAADTNLQTQIDNILTNVDPSALDSLTEIVTAFTDADDIFTATFLTTATNISGEIAARIAADLTLTTNLGLTQAELDASQVGAGLTAAGAYVVGGSTNYLSTATSLSDADVKLDIQSKVNADAIAAEASTARSAESTNANNITTNTTDIVTNATAITTEQTRALTAESALSSANAAEITARGNADTAVRTEFAAADALQTIALETYADTAETDAIAAAATDATNKDTAQSTVLTTAYVAADAVVTTAYEAADTVLSGRATTLETEMDTAEGRLDAIEASTGGSLGSLDTLSQTISGAVNEIHTDTDAVEVRVTTAEADIVTNANDIANIISNTDAGALDSLTELLAEFQSADGTLTGLINANATAIITEQTRASGVESTNAAAIVTETNRATAAEGVNATSVTTEAGTRSTADTALQTNIDAEATTRGNADTALQTELNDSQTGAGLNADGTYTATATADYISAATSLKDADAKLDIQTKTNADAIAAEVTRAGNAEVANANNIATNVTNIGTNATDIAQEITDRGTAVSTLQGGIDDVQAELDTTQVGAGLSVTGSYVQNAAANYIAASTSLNDADVKLDAALKVEEIRALAAEGLNTTAISDELITARAAESAINTKIDNEVVRSIAIDVTNTANIATNSTDIGLNLTAINAEIATRISADNILTNNLAAEAATARAAEVVNATAISDEVTRALAAESILTSNISTNTTAIANILTNVDPSALDSLTEIVTAFQGADATINGAITSLSTTASTDRALIRTEMLAADSALQVELNTTQAGAGLSTSGTYVTPSGSNYIDTATSFANAEMKLDAAIKAVETAVLNSDGTSSAASTANLTEITATQAGAGLSVTGTYVAPTTSNYHDAATSLANADMVLDTALKAEADRAIAAEGVNATDITAEETRATNAESALSTTIGNNDTQVRSDYASADSVIQNELNTTQAGAGLSVTGTYVAPTTSNYHDAATSLTSADMVLDTALKAEETRALLAEGVNATAISDEETRATTAEGVNATAISTETSRASGVEAAQATDIANNLTEITATQAGAGLSVTGAYVAPTTSNYHDTATSLANADMKLDAAIKAEEIRALAAEGVITGDISAETTRAGIAEVANANAIIAEATTARAAESTNANVISTVSGNLATEIANRTNADTNLQGQIDFITSNVDAASLDSLTEIVAAFQTADGDLLSTVTANTTAINDEEIRALAAEGVNATQLSNEITRATTAEGSNIAAINNEEGRAIAAEGILTTAVGTKVAKSGDSMTGVLGMGGNKITSLASPDAATDAANKSYVDSVTSAQSIGMYSTDDLSEGSTNKYYTDARAQTAISVVDTEGAGRVSYSAGVVTVDTSKSFLELTDYVGGEADYSANANYIAVVNTAGTGMVLVDPTGLLASDVQRQTLNGDDITVTFALTFDVGSAEDLMVFVGGVIQDPSVHYTVNAGANSITFTGGAIPTGTQAVVVGHQTGYTVANGSVGATKLAPEIKAFVQSDGGSVTPGGNVIDTFVAAEYRTAKYIIQVSDASNGEYESREALIVHNGSTAYITEFAMVYTGASLIGNASVAMNGSNVELTYTTTSVTATVKIIATYIDA
jgi:hypothetical protein